MATASAPAALRSPADVFAAADAAVAADEPSALAQLIDEYATMTPDEILADFNAGRSAPIWVVPSYVTGMPEHPLNRG